MDPNNRKQSDAGHRLLVSKSASLLLDLATRGVNDDATNNKTSSDSTITNATKAGISTKSGTCTGEDDGTDTNNNSCSTSSSTSRVDHTISTKAIEGTTKLKTASMSEEATLGQDQSYHDDDSSRKNTHSSMSETIKETVLRRLERPEDITKYNMFSVEGKSIKFPVKVSCEFISLIRCLVCNVWNWYPVSQPKCSQSKSITKAHVYSGRV